MLLSLSLGDQAYAQGSRYREELSLFTAGENLHWRITISSANTTLPGLLDAERQVAGLMGFSLVATNSSKWEADFEVFSVNGYNLLGSILPTSGIVLDVDADSVSSASDFASLLGRNLATHFTPIATSGTGRVTFYAHAAFRDLLSERLWKAVPTTRSGFHTLSSLTSFSEELVPVFQLEGRRDGASFIHALSLSGIRKGAVKGDSFNLATIFPSAANTNSSSSSDSSLIRIHSAGSLMVKSSVGKSENLHRNDPTEFSALLEASLDRSKRIPQINATLLTKQVRIVATRTTDMGALGFGDLVEVRIRVKNDGPPGSPEALGIVVKEDWWSGQFALEGGNPNETIGSLRAQEERVLAYQLRVTERSPIEVTPPSTQNVVPYSFRVGNATISRTTKMNPISLILNDPGPALVVQAEAKEASPRLGDAKPAKVNVKNVGTRTAFSLRAQAEGAAPVQNPSLPPGSTWSFEPELLPGSLRLRPIDFAISAEWVDRGRLHAPQSSNSILLSFSPKEIKIPMVRVVKEASAEADSFAMRLRVFNRGTADAGPIRLQEFLPTGTRILGEGFEVRDRSAARELPSLPAGSEQVLSYSLELTKRADNHVLPPAVARIKSGRMEFATLSNSLAMPLGVRISKKLSPLEGFIGTIAGVEAQVVNGGTLPIYSVRLDGGLEPVASIVNGQQIKAVDVVAGGDVLRLNYTARFTRPWSSPHYPATVSFLFAGERVTVSSDVEPIRFHEPLILSILTNPERPVEGRPFAISALARNPTDLTLSDVEVEVILPPGVRVVDGSLKLSAAKLGPLGVIRLNATAVSERALEFRIQDAFLRFKYLGGQHQGTFHGKIIAIEDDVGSRFGLPIGLALAVILATTLAVKGRLPVRQGSRER